MLFNRIEITIANTTPNYQQIETLADTIWREHYIPITGIGQVEHMLKKYQSTQAISAQVEAEGFEYFVLAYDGIPVGYISIRKEKEWLFLSKIYVLSNYRGNKIGKTAMQFIEEKAKLYHLKTIMPKFMAISISIIKMIRFIPNFYPNIRLIFKLFSNCFHF